MPLVVHRVHTHHLLQHTFPPRAILGAMAGT